MKHNRTLRRGLGVLLALVMCLSLLPATALAEEPATKWADFTSGNGSDALALLNAAKTGDEDSTWDSETKVLTLKGVNFTTIGSPAVLLPADATIVLADGTTNTITNSVLEGTGTSCGIYAKGDLNIQGNGTLTATGTKVAETSAGIWVSSGDVTISGGTVTAEGGAAKYSYGIYAVGGDVTISGGTVTATGGEAAYSYGIDATSGDVIISGKNTDVTATGGDATGISNGIFTTRRFSNNAYIAGDIKISGSAKVTAAGGKAGSYSYGICAGNSVTISGKNTDVTATGDTAEGYSYGIATYTANVTISDATVEATGGAAKRYSYGICSYYNETTIDGGTVTAIGGTATGEESDSYGILANTNLKISGGSVTATGDTAKDESFGLFAYGDITISDPAEVTATGDKAGSCSDGIYAGANIGISGGTVTATGGEVSGEDAASFGIESKGSIIISGGHVIARTLAGTDAPTRAALMAAPDLSSYTGYRWRTSSEASFTASTTTPYTYDAAHNYVEISSTEDSYDLPIGWLGWLLLPIDSVVSHPFVDVPPMYYYFDAVNWAAENGITGGVDDTHFAPDAACTRAQIVTFLWRAAGCPAPKSSVNPFTDVAEGSYYYDAVLWAVEQGITKGATDTTFSPNATCTRAQIVTFLWRAQGSPAAGTANPFTDVAADTYYAGAVLWAAENGITGGTTATTFSPDSDCTRAQIVTFLYRCLG